MHSINYKEYFGVHEHLMRYINNTLYKAHLKKNNRCKTLDKKYISLFITVIGEQFSSLLYILVRLILV